MNNLESNPVEPNPSTTAVDVLPHSTSGIAPGSRIIVAMSGGVDSCVAAAILAERGFDVVGITMQLWNHGSEGEARFDSCCSLTDVHDARLAAHQIGVPHYVVNYEKEFRSGVVDYFAKEYSAGRTPNPCVMCNSKLKFDHLVDRAGALGAEWVATGHFARVVHHDDGRPSELYRGHDPRKDQSYFLFNLKPDMLRRVLFPLAEMTKDEVRRVAGQFNLHTKNKHESQEICFVSGKRYTDFLEQHYPQQLGQKGEIVSRSGEVLGYHDGIHKFTVGQRKGLNISSLEAKYVAAIDAATGRVVVDDLENLACEEFTIPEVNWLIPGLEAGNDAIECEVVVRYRGSPIACRVEKNASGAWRVLLAVQAKWVTPGQAAVFYQEDRVLGGGFIGSRPVPVVH
jgi:tRNA-specific 2-thiouridylase